MDNRKLVIPALAVTAAGAALFYILYKTNKEINESVMSPEISKSLTRELRKLKNLLITAISQQKSLDPTFFEILHSEVYKKTKEAVEISKKDKITQDIKKTQLLDPSRYNKEVIEYAKAREIIEEEALKEIYTELKLNNECIKFIFVSNIQLLRTNPNSFAEILVEGPSARRADLNNRIIEKSLPEISNESFEAIAEHLIDRIGDRIKQGFKYVNKDYFTTIFELELYISVYDKFNTDLDQFWAKGFYLEDTKNIKNSTWKSLTEKYKCMYLKFYEADPLLKQGLRVNTEKRILVK